MSCALRVLAPLALLGASLVAGCGGAPTRAGAAPNTAAPLVTVPEPSAAGAPSAQSSTTPGSPRTAASGPEQPRPPQGYVEMTVVGVAPTADGQAVLLVDESKTVVVPIFVAGTEALSIQMRQRKERYQRPLTHDLLDAIMRELGGSLVKVHVDDIKGSTFVGAVFVRTGTRVVEIDARPSDAIALAIGNHVPIFVAQRVIDEAGVRKEATADPTPPGAVPHI